MSPEPDSLAEGTLISHLLELRERLIRALVAIGILFVPCALYANQLFTWLAEPLLKMLPKGSSLIATGVAAPFTTPFKLAFFVALFGAMPYVLYQVWAFIAPGLYRHEKRFALPLLVSSIVLFYTGMTFAYFAVFPAIFHFFAATTPKGVAMMTDISQYLDFVLVLFFAFGAAFEVPVAVVLLVVMNLVSVQKLRAIRGYVLLGVFIVAAFITPPDAVSQSIMAVPMYLLYEAGVIMARILVRPAPNAAGEEPSTTS
ncbi:MAG: twin-arginine translocase subunit TatC [Pseudomonadota bacterium]|jgi:sec-independent protein translocase protein TatC|nr:twin-arginine translocase subunit TatC [Pseudomonadota bacterium]